LADAEPRPEPPLQRTPGLKAAVAAGALVYVILFVLTTFPQSPSAETQAARYFNRQEIEQGQRFAMQRRLFFWGSTAVQLLFLGFVVFTGFARKLADFCARLVPGGHAQTQESRAGDGPGQADLARGGRAWDSFHSTPGGGSWNEMERMERIRRDPNEHRVPGPNPPPEMTKPGLARRTFAFLHWLTTVLLVGAFCFVAVELLVLPIRLGRLENARAWGMTDRSVLSWLEDYGKSLAVVAILGGVVLAGLYVLIRLLPRWWWAVGATLSIALGFFYAFILPEVITPLFNTFTPLRDPDLLRRVRALAARAGVPVETVLVMDASRQGRHTNAYFTGVGPTRRIVLYDTLLRPLYTLPPESAATVIGLLGTPGPGAVAGPVEAGMVVAAHRREAADEIESILAHEIGHWQHNHIFKGILLAGLGAYVGLYLVARILRWAVGRSPFALRSPSDPAGIPLLLLLSVLGTWAALPVENLVSRHFERQADAAALELADRPRAFIAAEKRLVRDNLGNVAPNSFSVWLFASHPPAVERIQMAEEWRAKSGK
jgi:STE24 endopeptidase